VFKKKKLGITFSCRKEILDIIPHPVEASKAMPEWFRKLGRDIKGLDKTQSGTIKRCVPVLDAVSQGYIIPLWCDVHVKVFLSYVLFNDKDVAIGDFEGDAAPDHLIGKEGNGHIISRYEFVERKILVQIPEQMPPTDIGISRHGWDQVGEQCDLKKFEVGRVLFKFNNPWVIETPKGWSVQIKNPANNFSNDIHLLEGVVDTDEYVNNINFPFVWTGADVGEWIIPKGTPIAQVIPFERKKISKTVCAINETKRTEILNKMGTIFNDRYRSMFWHKR